MKYLQLIVILAQPPEYLLPSKKRKTRKQSTRKPIFAFSKRIMVGWHDTEGFASLHPRLRATRSARAFDLSGRAAAFLNTDLHK